ncbi:MAG: hypothetical protein GWP05_09685, partial [Anaerolineaceae bacterium]|nr:hypothetical protein [Anaerolineaceae bacterium]
AAGTALAQADQGLTAFERAQQEARILRRRSMAQVRELLGDVEPLIAAQRYVDADIKLRAAKRIVKTGRYLSAAEQGALLAEVNRLDQILGAGKAEYLRGRQEKTAREISLRDDERRKSAVEFAERRRAAHWLRLRQFRDQRKYTKALSEARAILARDANDQAARRTAEQMAFQAEWARQYNLRLTRRGETRKSLIDVEASTIPYSKIYRYGDARRWEELAPRRLSGLLRESGATTRRLEALDSLDRRINLDMEDVTLANVGIYLSEAAGVPIVIDPRLEDDTGKSADDETVTIHIKQVTLRQALNMMLPEEMGWRQEAGQIIISSREKANPLKVRTYAIRHLTAEVPDFGKTVPQMRLGEALGQTNTGGGSGGGIFDTADNTSNNDAGPPPQDRIIELIKRFVTSGDPRVAEWEDNGGTATVEYFNGLLIVSQTEAGHRKVAALLARF